MHNIELDLLPSCPPERRNIKIAVICRATFRYWVLNKPMSRLQVLVLELKCWQ